MNTYNPKPIDVSDVILEEDLTELREAIKRYLARNRGIEVSTEQIIIGSGSEYLYGLIVELLGRNKTFAIEFPAYKKIEQVYRAAEINYESLSLTPSGIDSSALNSSKSLCVYTSSVISGIECPTILFKIYSSTLIFIVTPFIIKFSILSLYLV